jgi:hypothetical protein
MPCRGRDALIVPLFENGFLRRGEFRARASGDFCGKNCHLNELRRKMRKGFFGIFGGKKRVFQMQNACLMQNAECLFNAKCRMQNAEWRILK